MKTSLLEDDCLAIETFGTLQYSLVLSSHRFLLLSSLGNSWVSHYPLHPCLVSLILAISKQWFFELRLHLFRNRSPGHEDNVCTRQLSLGVFLVSHEELLLGP